MTTNPAPANLSLLEQGRINGDTTKMEAIQAALDDFDLQLIALSEDPEQLKQLVLNAGAVGKKVIPIPGTDFRDGDIDHSNPERLNPIAVPDNRLRSLTTVIIDEWIDGPSRIAPRTKDFIDLSLKDYLNPEENSNHAAFAELRANSGAPSSTNQNEKPRPNYTGFQKLSETFEGMGIKLKKLRTGTDSEFNLGGDSYSFSIVADISEL